MRVWVLAVIAAVACMPAYAQSARSEADRQDSRMGLPSAGTEGANNGVGTAGSIDGQEGKASSTVSGVAGSGTSINTQGSNRGAGGAVENDPAQGGGQQRQ